MRNDFNLLAVLILCCTIASAQDTTDIKPMKGSYLYYGQPAIEDNSMLIEEAFNQEAGVIQHISNLIVDNGNVVYAYTQEIPIPNEKHQLSFGVSYAAMQRPEGSLFNNNFLTNGFGDILVNYRPMLMDKNQWALVIPRFTLIAPTGNARYGLGYGAWGGQFNMAVTKRLSSKLTTHWNAGFTKLWKADSYQYLSDGTPERIYEKDLTFKNVGASLIWLVAPKFNLMVEYVSAFDKTINDTGSLDIENSTVINPGFRFAVDMGKVQIVPGMGVPVNFSNGSFANTAVIFYLSIEPAY
jgi:hypothetical protein